MFMLVRDFVNMYIHVCTMYRDVCTDLPFLVQVVRIPDVELGTRNMIVAWVAANYLYFVSESGPTCHCFLVQLSLGWALDT